MAQQNDKQQGLPPASSRGGPSGLGSFVGRRTRSVNTCEPRIILEDILGCPHPTITERRNVETFQATGSPHQAEDLCGTCQQPTERSNFWKGCSGCCKFFCTVANCGREFGTQRGVGQHIRRGHAELDHASEDTSRKKNRPWTEEDMLLIASEEAKLGKVRFINIELQKTFPHRTTEHIRKLRAQAKYQAILEDFLSAARSPPIESPGEASHDNLQGESDAAQDSNILMQAVDFTLLSRKAGKDISPEMFKGPVSPQVVKAIDDLLEAVLPARSKRGTRPAPSVYQHTPDAVHRFSRHRRRAEYTRLQKLWRSNETEASTRVIDGTWRAEDKQVTLEQLRPFWESLLSQDSEPDNRTPSKVRSLRGLLTPVTCEELAKLLKGCKGASGLDGWKWNNLKEVIPELTAMFNLWLATGVQPTRLLKGYTTLIPKVLSTEDPAKFRPITVTSVIIRLLHKIMARRLGEALQLDEDQRGFRQGDGISINVRLLEGALSTSISKRLDLAVCFIDVAKAFDSVSHPSLMLSCERMGIPDQLISYLKYMYSNSSTVLKVCNQYSSEIGVRRGIKQGDPLSCLLFNCVIDWALSGIRKDVGLDMGNGEKLTHLAFADDVVLLARTQEGLKRQVNAYCTELGKMGLSINPKKCATVHIKWQGGRANQRWVCSPRTLLSIGDTAIPPLTISDTYKYLGVRIGASGTAVGSLVGDLKSWLQNIKAAPLKPEQRMKLLRVRVVPKLLHVLGLAKVTKGTLKYIDLMLRDAAKTALQLPSHTLKAMYHAPITSGGLGIPSMVLSMPVLQAKRIEAVLNSTAKSASWLRETTYFQDLLKKCNNTVSHCGIQLTSGSAVRESLSKELHNSVDGKGLAHAVHVTPAHQWVYGDDPFARGKDYRAYVHVRLNVLPTPARKTRIYGAAVDGLCSLCRVPATLGHICQSCPRTHGMRIRRHDNICGYVEQVLTSSRFQVLVEPRIQYGNTFRKPDLVAIKGNEALILDVAVVADNCDPNMPALDKINKYDQPEIRRRLHEMYDVSVYHFAGIVCSWRGVLASSSAHFLKNHVGFCGSQLNRIATRALKGTALCYFCWLRST